MVDNSHLSPDVGRLEKPKVSPGIGHWFEGFE